MEKKKRVRPTLTQVRALEAEIAELRQRVALMTKGVDENDVLRQRLEEQIDGTSSLVRDCNLWREKYQQQVLKDKELAKKVRELQSELSAVPDGYVSKEEYDKMREACEHLNEELTKERGITGDLMEKERNLILEVERLRGRGFWKRVFNR